MLTLHDALYLLLLPAVLALILSLSARLLIRKPMTRRRGRRIAWPATLAITLGPLAAGLLLFPPHLPPRDPLVLLQLTPLLALLAGLIASLLPFLISIIVVLAAALASAAACLHLLADAPPDLSYWPTLLAATLVPTLLYAALSPLPRRQPTPTFLSMLLGLALATTLVASASSCMQLSQYAMTFPAALAGLLLSLLSVRNLTLARGPLAAFLLFWTALLFYGYIWADVPLTRTLLLAAAPLAAWIGEIPILRKSHPLLRAAAVLLAVALIAAPAFFPAAQEVAQLIKSQTTVTPE